MAITMQVSKLSDDTSQDMVESISTWLKQDPKNEVFYLVPDHIKYSAEVHLIHQLGRLEGASANTYAQTRLHVYSFKRLAWYMTKEGGGEDRSYLSPVMMALLVQKILMEHPEDFLLFQAEAQHKGFIEEAVKVLQEFYQGGLDKEDLSFLDHLPQRNQMQERLWEFARLYSYFLDSMGGDYLLPSQVLVDLANRLFPQKLDHVMVIVDRFVAFSAQELQVIEALEASCGQVLINLVLRINLLEKQEGPGLFDSNRALLSRIGQVLGKTSQDPWIRPFDGQEAAFHSDFFKLENWWINRMGGQLQAPVKVQDRLERVQVIAYKDPNQEIEESLVTIKDLVASGDYRYRDIQVFTRSLEQDIGQLEAKLTELQIPYFIDQAESMDKHPLMQVLEALFAIQENFWRYHDILSLLRTEYLFWPLDNQATLEDQAQALGQFREKVDRAELLILTNGYQGKAWFDQIPWYNRPQFIDEEGEEITDQAGPEEVSQRAAQDLKDLLKQSLAPLLKSMGQASNSQEAIASLYQGLVRMGLEKAFRYWRDQAANQGDLQTARRQDQVWGVFVQVLDDYVQVFGQDPFDWSSFHAMVKTAFEHSAYQMAPSTLDQLQITSYDSIRYQSKKVSFALGLNQGVLPRNIENKGLLTDQERDYLNGYLDSGHFLNPNSLMRQSVEAYVFYQTLLSATDRLILSYPQSNRGTSQEASAYLTSLAKDFELGIQDGDKRSQDRLASSHFMSSNEMFSQLLGQLRKLQDKGSWSPPSLWMVLASHIKNHPDYQQAYQKLIQSVFRLNQPKRLPTSLAGKLYGQELYLSTSQVESYYRDPFAHFLQYGLRLREYKELDLSPASTGDYFHQILDSFIQNLDKADRDWAYLTQEELLIRLRQVSSTASLDPRFAIFSTSARMAYLQKRLDQTLAYNLEAILKHYQVLRLTPFATELQFGRGGEAVDGKLGLDQVKLRGKIDRIDWTQIGDKAYLTIVDYKSSEKKIQAQLIEAGLQLQLFAYLGIALNLVQAKTGLSTQPLAAGYLHIHQGRYKAENVLGKDLDKLRQGDHKLKGLAQSDKDLLQAIEDSLDQGSVFFPVDLKKDGSFTAKSWVADTEEFQLLIEYTMEKINQAANEILSGDVRLRPYHGQISDSVQGKFASISQFDATNPENQYRRLKSLTLKQLLEKIKEGRDQEHES